MTTPSLTTDCPQCGSPIPEGAPGGQCPRCLLGAVAATEPAPHFGGVLNWPTLDEVRAGFPDLDVEAEIGRGGMAVVYRARQIRLDRLVALKVLAPWLASQPDFSERFTREARTLARLNHPAIVTIHDFGETAGFYWLLMEYVDGVNLRQAMQAGRFEPAQALEIVPRICEALQYAHSQGVLHRDIKPDNILLDTSGQVKLADFGIAKLAGEAELALTLTQSGMHLGTPAYMAPEQVEKPGDVDHRADIYSLGVVFYEMLTGELPLGRFAAPSEKATIDARIDEIVFRTLEKERERRYQSAAEVKTSVQSVGDLPPPPPHAAAPMAATAVSVATVATVATVDDAELSRRGLRAAAFTAGSICVVALVLMLGAFLFGPGRGGPGARHGGLSVVGVLMVGLSSLLALGSAAAGMILGASALGTLRHSGGRKEGSGFATFALLAWPVGALVFGMGVLGAALGENLFERRMAPTVGGMLHLATFLGCLAGGIWMAVAIVKATLRWARGGGQGGGVPAGSAAAKTVAAPEDAKVSGLAVSSAIVTTLSLASGMVMTVLAVYLWLGVRSDFGSGRAAPPSVGMGPAELLLASCFGGLLPLVGTVLGIAAMSGIRGSQGRKKGAGLAVYGGMTWPALMAAVLSYTLVLFVLSAVSRIMPQRVADSFMAVAVAIGIGCAAMTLWLVLRAALRWTTACAPNGSRFPGLMVAVIVLIVLLAPVGLIGSWLLVPSRVVEYRASPVASGAGPAFPSLFTSDSSITVNESRGTSRLLNGRPELHCTLEINYAATVPPFHEVFLEIRRDRVDRPEATVETLQQSALRAGEQSGGQSITMHRAFEYEFPPESTNQTLDEARRQINATWLHRPVPIAPGQPKPLFSVKLPDGSMLTGTFNLRPSLSDQ